MPDRSQTAIVRNPLLALPGAGRIAALPKPARDALGALLLDIRKDAAARAQKAWASHKAPMACYWKAVSVYAGHAARLCRDQPAPAWKHTSDDRPRPEHWPQNNSK